MLLTGESYRRFMGKVAVTATCWEWTAAKTKDGYGEIGFRGKTARAHRVAFLLFVGEIPPGLSVLHTCDNPGCVNPAHLYAGTQAMNVRDRIERGRSRHPFGENHGRAKLTEKDVAEIRAALASGCVQRRLSERFGVTPTTILKIKKGELWAR